MKTSLGYKDSIKNQPKIKQNKNKKNCLDLHRKQKPIIKFFSR